MRAFLCILLTGLVIACPAICGAADACGTHGQAASEDSTPPFHCPGDGDVCICDGAVATPDTQVTALELQSAALFFTPVHSTAHPLAHLTRDGSPTGLAGWGDAASVRAYLQIFRC